MNEEKLTRFMNDEAMNKAVFKVLLDVFMKPKPNAPTDEKAARFISIEELQNAWKELERYRNPIEKGQSEIKQVGL